MSIREVKHVTVTDILAQAYNLDNATALKKSVEYLNREQAANTKTESD